MNLEDLFEGFSELFDKEKHDWEKLKQTGRVEENIINKGGLRTITKTYISHDGLTKITEISSDFEDDRAERKKKINYIEDLIKKAVEEEDYEKAIELRNEKKQITNYKMINILYFQAKWCSGCNAIKSSINEASQQPNVRVKTIDTDYDISTTQQYNVSSIPTVILVEDNGTEIRRFVGNKSRTEIEKFING